MTSLRRKRPSQVASRQHPGDISLLADWFEQALLLHQSGKLAEAGVLYRQILSVEPAHFDALHLLGVISCQHGDYHEGARLIGEA